MMIRLLYILIHTRTQNTIMLTKLLSLSALGVVKSTISGATNDKNVIKPLHAFHQQYIAGQLKPTPFGRPNEVDNIY